jgi:hypothetical protein
MQTEKQRERLVELLKKADESASNKMITDYEDAIKDNADYLIANNVVVLPWKKGDTLYSVTRLVDGKLEPYQINVEEHKFKEIRYFIICENDNFLDSCWGKSLFADKEEAEKYAKNMAEQLVLKAKEHLEKAENVLKERKENVK